MVLLDVLSGFEGGLWWFLEIDRLGVHWGAVGGCLIVISFVGLVSVLFLCGGFQDHNHSKHQKPSNQKPKTHLKRKKKT